jgi:hypothetical protein
MQIFATHDPASRVGAVIGALLAVGVNRPPRLAAVAGQVLPGPPPAIDEADIGEFLRGALRA